MINHNGEILPSQSVHFSADFRPIQYGDALFETMKYTAGVILFWEDHYFRLMASMRILRMEIPMKWSPEYLERQIHDTVQASHLDNGAARIRLTVYRDGPGRYTPASATIGFFIQAEAWPDKDYRLNDNGLVMDVFKDYEKPKSMLGNLKTTNSLLYTLAGIFARENELDDCFLLNTDKHVVETVSANLFMLRDGMLYTAPTESGTLKGVMRKQIIRQAGKWGLTVEETGFSPFELQRADEVWTTSSLRGIQWVGQYRKKKYGNEIARTTVDKLNALVEQGIGRRVSPE